MGRNEGENLFLLREYWLLCCIVPREYKEGHGVGGMRGVALGEKEQGDCSRPCSSLP